MVRNDVIIIAMYGINVRNWYHASFSEKDSVSFVKVYFKLSLTFGFEHIYLGSDNIFIKSWKSWKMVDVIRKLLENN